MKKCPYCGAGAITVCRCFDPREVNTQNHRRVNAEAMKRAYADADVEVSPTKLEYLTELLAQGIINSDAAVERQIYMESLRARAIEEAGMNASVQRMEHTAEHGRDHRCVASVFGHTACPCNDCKARRALPTLEPVPPPPMERKPTPKCPPSCTPVEPCKRVACAAMAYLEKERGVARLMAETYGVEGSEQPPRPEARRIGAADLSFGRWNGRVPR